MSLIRIVSVLNRHPCCFVISLLLFFQSGATALAALRSSSHFLAAGTDSVVRLLTVADGVAERTFMVKTRADLLCFSFNVIWLVGGMRLPLAIG